MENCHIEQPDPGKNPAEDTAKPCPGCGATEPDDCQCEDPRDEEEAIFDRAANAAGVPWRPSQQNDWEDSDE